MRTVWKGIALALIASAALLGYLVSFQGLRIERDGTGIWPVVSFYKPEEHIAAIERHRMPAPSVPETPVPEASTPAVNPELKTAAPAVASYWTSFRGPHRDGIYDEMP